MRNAMRNPTRNARHLVLAAAVALGFAGCALTSKSKPLEVRYFTPAHAEAPDGEPALAGPAPGTAPALELRLGRVDAASYLREKIAYRDSANEVGYYETLRWTEAPDAFVRRALGRALFQQHGLEEVVSGIAPQLEVELTAFEEVRAPKHVVRVEMTWKLRDHRNVLFQRTVRVEKPVDDAAPGAIAAAMGVALDEAVETTVTDVVAALTRARVRSDTEVPDARVAR
jgi:ABC-type uncharacterized transport system auxiliary subunit